jgi:adenosine/AMP kinase
MPGRSRETVVRRREEARRRHAEPTWYEWTLQEFLRYMYLVGAFALFLMIPLQMVEAWLPRGRPPVLSPVVVAGFALGFDALAAYLAVRAYMALWGRGGLVDRAVERREGAAAKPFSPPRPSPAGMSVDVREVEVENPEHLNVIVGQTHFIKTAEDLYEALVNSVPEIQFGLAFCEASGPCLVRAEGTDAALKDLAVRNALRIGAGHTFVVFVRNAYPINLLRAIREVPEVVGLFAATSNPLTVLVAETARGRGVVGVIDGEAAKGVESEADVRERRALVRRFGYKL